MIKLLLVDDEPIIIKGLRRMMDAEALGVEIVGEANDGRRALELIERLAPDIVLTDIWMPVMDGIELMRAVSERAPHVKVIVLSGYGEFAYAKRAIGYGAVDYLLKPVGIRELEEALMRAQKQIEQQRALRQYRVADEAQDQPDEDMDAMDRVRAHIAQHCGEDLALARLAGMAYMNPSYFSALFKKRYGETLKDYITRVRMERAAQLILRGNLKGYEIAEQVGYKNVRHFNFVFKNFYGLTPTGYKARGGAKG